MESADRISATTGMPEESSPPLAPASAAKSPVAPGPSCRTVSPKGRCHPSLSLETARQILTSWHSSRPGRTFYRRRAWEATDFLMGVHSCTADRMTDVKIKTLSHTSDLGYDIKPPQSSWQI
ncbi:hypothetical protein LEMLEM_LOCUS13299 [Lemmus lemmus]